MTGLWGDEESAVGSRQSELQLKARRAAAFYLAHRAQTAVTKSHKVDEVGEKRRERASKRLAALSREQRGATVLQPGHSDARERGESP